MRKVPVILASAQTDMFRPTTEYRSDNSSGLHCIGIFSCLLSDGLLSGIRNVVDKSIVDTRADDQANIQCNGAWELRRSDELSYCYSVAHLTAASTSV